MLEDRSLDSCLISRVFSSSCLSESNWCKSYMYPEDDDASENKLSNGKRALEVAGEIRQTKSIKLMGFSIKYDSDSSDYSLSGGEEQADAVGNGDGSSRQEQEEST